MTTEGEKAGRPPPPLFFPSFFWALFHKRTETRYAKDLPRPPLVLYCCLTAALLLLYCCFTAALLLLYCCFTAALLLLYCCFTAALQRERERERDPRPPLVIDFPPPCLIYRFRIPRFNFYFFLTQKCVAPNLYYQGKNRKKEKSTKLGRLPHDSARQNKITKMPRALQPAWMEEGGKKKKENRKTTVAVTGMAIVLVLDICVYVSIRQHTSAYVSIRQHTSAYVSIRQHTTACVSIR